MKRMVLSSWFLVLGVCGAVTTVYAKNLIPQLEKAPVASSHPPKVPVQVLDNGLTVYTYENHELPLFKATIYIQTVSAYEPSSKAGLAALTAELQTTGGAGARTPQELDIYLDDNAIHLESGSGKELTWITVSSLKENWDQALALLWQVVLEPRFDPERFQLAKSRSIERIRRQMDYPATIASQELTWELYGKKSPWARIPTERSVRKIGLKDLVRWHGDYFKIQRMTLVSSGDFSTGPLVKAVKEKTAGLQPQAIPEVRWDPIALEQKGKTKKIRKKLTQVVITAGGMALPRNDPDRYAYSLLQYVLGGSTFVSRLGNDIRSQRGLAYGADSYWVDNPRRGHFRISVQTKVGQEVLVLERIRANVTDLAGDKPVTAKELKEAKEAMLNQYVFLFENPFEIPFQQARFDLLGYPKDYLASYPQKIRSVTLEQVRAAAQKYLTTDPLKIVIVGP